jgi:entericidin A
MNKLITLLVSLSAILVVGCNTMSGLGKDVSKLGDKIERKAEEKRN